MCLFTSDCCRHRVRALEDRLDRLLHLRRVAGRSPAAAAGGTVLQSDDLAAEDAEGEPAAAGEEHLDRRALGLRGDRGQQLAK